MEIGITHLHSTLPYIFLVTMIIAIAIFWSKRFSGAEFGKNDKRFALINLILAHLQLIIGLVLYIFISPIAKAARESGEMWSDPNYRFYGVVHISVMIIGIVLITIGYSKSKRQEDSASKFKTLSLFYTLGLVFILSGIPWDNWL